MEYARLEFWLSVVDKGTQYPRRKHIEQIQKSTGKWPANAPNKVDLPKSLSYVWFWYLQISNNTSVTPQELESWSRITGNNLTHFEYNLMLGIELEAKRNDRSASQART